MKAFHTVSALVVLMVTSCLILGCSTNRCTQIAPSVTSEQATEREVHEAQLRLRQSVTATYVPGHVVGTSFAVSSNRMMSAAHIVPVRETSQVVLGGVETTARFERGDLRATGTLDWIEFSVGSEPELVPLPYDSEKAIKRGHPVWIAGYPSNELHRRRFVNYGKYDIRQSDLAELAMLCKQGSVVRAPKSAKYLEGNPSELLWVRVDATKHDVEGVSGGPACIQLEDGTFVAIGICILAWEDPKGGVLIGVKRVHL